MTFDQLLEELDRSSWDDQKNEKIQEYLTSHKKVSKKPKIFTRELLLVIDEFRFSEGKLNTLKTLHTHIADRENLPTMIEKAFSSPFDQEDARKIVGL